MMSKADRMKKRISRRRRTTMIHAHNIAKMIVRRVGDYQIAMSIALKFVYKFRAEKQAGEVEDAARNAFEPKFIAGVPVWAIKKDFLGFQARNIIDDTISTKALKETEKAVQIEFVLDDGFGVYERLETWVAKSIMVA